MQAKTPLKLIDPYSKESLEEDGNTLKSASHSFEIQNFENSSTVLINFNPEVSISSGAYEDNLSQDSYQGLKASGLKFPPNYKSLCYLNEFEALPQGAVVLDIGCNKCELLSELPDHFFKVGVDISDRTFFWSEPNVLDANVDQLWVLDAKNLPLEDESVDAVICTDLLEHLLEPQKIIDEVQRVLKPGGLFVVSVPNLVHLANRLSMLVGYGSGIEFAQLLKGKSPFIPMNAPRFPDQSMHIRWFTQSSLTKYIGSFGFDVTKKFSCGPILSRLKLNSVFKSWGLLIGLIAKKK